MPTPRGRREHLLAWLLISILLLVVASLLAVLIVNPPGSPRRGAYLPFVLEAGAVIVLAYLLNAAGRYRMASALTVLCATITPWVAMEIDPAILRGDFVPLAYAWISVLLCSLLLSPLVTTLLAALQFTALSWIALTHLSAPINWASLLALILFSTVLSTISSSISQGYLDDIEHQTRLLEESEARLRELSVRDHLTHLFNRRYLEETLEREIRRSQREQHSIGLILFDLDGFKAINDQWGHAAGDAVLRQVGQLFTGHIRGGDIACRYGGDEFVLMLPGGLLRATQLRAAQLRRETARLRCDFHGQLLPAVTLSAGVAMYPQNGAHGDALLKAADKAMYRAKRNGRNRVVVAEQAST